MFARAFYRSWKCSLTPPEKYSLNCESTFHVLPRRWLAVTGSCRSKQNAQFTPAPKVFIPQCRVSPSRAFTVRLKQSSDLLGGKLNRLINKNHRHIVSCSSKAIYGSCLGCGRTPQSKNRVPLTICLHAANTASQSAEMPLVIKDAEADLVSAISVQ